MAKIVRRPGMKLGTSGSGPSSMPSFHSLGSARGSASRLSRDGSRRGSGSSLATAKSSAATIKALMKESLTVKASELNLLLNSVQHSVEGLVAGCGQLLVWKEQLMKAQVLAPSATAHMLLLTSVMTRHRAGLTARMDTLAEHTRELADDVQSSSAAEVMRAASEELEELRNALLTERENALAAERKASKTMAHVLELRHDRAMLRWARLLTALKTERREKQLRHKLHVMSHYCTQLKQRFDRDADMAAAASVELPSFATASAAAGAAGARSSLLSPPASPSPPPVLIASPPPPSETSELGSWRASEAGETKSSGEREWPASKATSAAAKKRQQKKSGGGRSGSGSGSSSGSGGGGRQAKPLASREIVDAPEARKRVKKSLQSAGKMETDGLIMDALVKLAHEGIDVTDGAVDDEEDDEEEPSAALRAAGGFDSRAASRRARRAAAGAGAGAAAADGMSVEEHHRVLKATREAMKKKHAEETAQLRETISRLERAVDALRFPGAPPGPRSSSEVRSYLSRSADLRSMGALASSPLRVRPELTAEDEGEAGEGGGGGGEKEREGGGRRAGERAGQARPLSEEWAAPLSKSSPALSFAEASGGVEATLTGEASSGSSRGDAALWSPAVTGPAMSPSSPAVAMPASFMPYAAPKGKSRGVPQKPAGKRSRPRYQPIGRMLQDAKRPVDGDSHGRRRRRR